MLWSHAYGRSIGYLRVLCSRGCQIPYLYPTGCVRFTRDHSRGPCGFISDMGVSVRSVLRECTVPCGCRSGLGIPARSFVQGLTGFGEARELGYIYQAKHDYVTFDPLVRFTDTSAPLPPRPLVTSAPSHLGPNHLGPRHLGPSHFGPTVASAPSHLGP